MNRILVEVDRDDFERFVERHGGTRQALDFLALKVDHMIRLRRRAVRKKESLKIEIPLRPDLQVLFDQYCREFKTNRAEVIKRIIRHKPNPRQ